MPSLNLEKLVTCGVIRSFNFERSRCTGRPSESYGMFLCQCEADLNNQKHRFFAAAPAFDTWLQQKGRSMLAGVVSFSF